MTGVGAPARLLRVYGLWVLLVTALVSAAAVGVSTTATPVYQSDAVVVVEARVRANTTPVAPEMGTEKQLARSGLVVAPAARSLAVSPDELLDGLVVSVAPDANVLTFSYTSPDAGTAQRRAQALARSYVAYRNSGEVKPAPGSAPNPAGAATSTQHATLVTAAPLPGAPSVRSIWVYLGIGLVLGLCLGVGTALIRDRLSDRLRGRSDFERVTGRTVLATIPPVRRRRRRRTGLPIILQAPHSPPAEAFRYLRSRLQPFVADGATVLVTSAGEREGRTTTAANLAAGLALAGRSVVLVDADLSGPAVHLAFGAADSAGLTSVLTGRCGLDEALQDGPVPGLRLLTAGPATEAAGDLFEGADFRRLLGELRERCDVVVLDSAPVLSVSDAITLAGSSDHVLFVADQRRTTRRYVTRALGELGDAAVSGVLLGVPGGADGHLTRGRPAAAPARTEPPAARAEPAAARTEPPAAAPAVHETAVPSQRDVSRR